MSMPLGYNDGILLISLLYSSLDISYEWASFDRCRHPIHHWLVVSFALVITFRLTQLLGMKTMSSGAGDFLLDLRQKDTVPRVLATFTWLCALPFFILWTLMGTRWLYGTVRETPACVPTSTHLWFSCFWLALCYVWIIIHVALGSVAWLLERRVRTAEVNMRQIEDDDVISRWGHVSSSQTFRSLSGSTQKGMSPAEITALPSFQCSECLHEEGIREDTQCSICLETVKPGDKLRQLEVCGHLFHRSCVDLWLLRSADCPLCKRGVRPTMGPDPMNADMGTNKRIQLSSY